MEGELRRNSEAGPTIARSLETDAIETQVKSTPRRERTGIRTTLAYGSGIGTIKPGIEDSCDQQ